MTFLNRNSIHGSLSHARPSILKLILKYYNLEICLLFLPKTSRKYSTFNISAKELVYLQHTQPKKREL